MSGDTGWEQQLSDHLRDRIRDAIQQQLIDTVHEQLAETLKKRVRETLRRRLADDVRAAFIEGQSGPEGFDVERVETKLSERLSETLH